MDAVLYRSIRYYYVRHGKKWSAGAMTIRLSGQRIDGACKYLCTCTFVHGMCPPIGYCVFQKQLSMYVAIGWKNGFERDIGVFFIIIG